MQNNIKIFDYNLDLNKINVSELKDLQEKLLKFCSNFIGLTNITILTSTLREEVQAYSASLQLKINDLIYKLSQKKVKNTD